jgi:hypothetical protein
MLVDCQRMKGILVVATKTGIQERIGRTLDAAKHREGHPQRANGIENADELDRNRLRIF